MKSTYSANPGNAENYGKRSTSEGQRAGTAIHVGTFQPPQPTLSTVPAAIESGLCVALNREAISPHLPAPNSVFIYNGD